MKKRLVSILIAAILIVSAVFVFAACDPDDKNVAELVAEDCYRNGNLCG